MKLLIVLFLFPTLVAAADRELKFSRLGEEGRHLVKVASCNDCHTAMFGPKGGNIPEKDWLLGDAVGFRGPWGTTYPSNLRKLVAAMDEKNFLKFMRERQFRPPMPTPAITAMTDQELRAIYAYLRELGDAGTVMPTYLPPGTEPKTPYIVFVPQAPRGLHGAR